MLQQRKNDQFSDASHPGSPLVSGGSWTDLKTRYDFLLFHDMRHCNGLDIKAIPNIHDMGLIHIFGSLKCNIRFFVLMIGLKKC